VKHLTELHGGTVEVVSGGVGAGTMLKLRIPAIAAADAPQLTKLGSAGGTPPCGASPARA
jgi:hypothetical protein